MAEVDRDDPALSAVATPPATDGEPTIEQVYAEHHEAVLGLAYVMSGRWSLAEEVTQEAFIRLMDGMAGGSVDNPAGWVRTVAVNLAQSQLRRTKAEVRALLRLRGRRQEHDQLDISRVESEAFWAVVRSLPARQAEAVALHYLEDRPVTAVAEFMGIAEGTAKALLHQARKGLADRLAHPKTEEDR